MISVSSLHQRERDRDSVGIGFRKSGQAPFFPYLIYIHTIDTLSNVVSFIKGVSE